jgi:ankyrin repeat protein
MRRRLSLTVLLSALALTIGVARITAVSPIADAAMRGDAAAVRTLIAQGADVNAPQGDGMTALHWTALNGDLSTVSALLAAGAKTELVTRVGNYTPLHLASSRAHGDVVAKLLDSGSNAKALTSTGVQAIHLASQAGSPEAVKALLDHGVDVNVRDETHGRTALVFATSEDRVAVMKVLIAKGANIGQTTNVIDYQQRSAADNTERQARDREVAAATGKMPIGNATGGVNGGGNGGAAVGGAAAAGAGQGRGGAAGAGAGGAARAGGAGAGGGRAGQPCDPNDPDIPCRGAGAGAARGPSDIQTIGKQGGFTALHYAVRDGFADAADALLDAGAEINRRSDGDLSTPLVVAAINGQYDIMIDLLKRGADPNLPSDDGVAPLFAVLNNEWALRTWYPQPTAGAQQKASYLDVLEALLKTGADPNERTLSHIWYASYNTGRMGVDFAGATPFWRAAYSLDVDAMRLLVKYGADPTIPTMSFGAPKRPNDPSGLAGVPTGGPDVPPFHAASGVGYGTSRVAQQHRHIPDGWMAATKYFVEELKVDVNIRDANGFSALHHAAARGDNEMVMYLVKHGADVMAVARSGQTTVDMANSPEQRTQPFPETIKLLEGMGAKNNHKCQACK